MRSLLAVGLVVALVRLEVLSLVIGSVALCLSLYAVLRVRDLIRNLSDDVDGRQRLAVEEVVRRADQIERTHLPDSDE